MPFFRVSVSDLSSSVSVAVDCQVTEILPHCADLVFLNLTTNHRIVSINGQPMKDRSELRAVLTSIPASAVVEVEYVLAMEHGKRVDISNSVECNGQQSAVNEEAASKEKSAANESQSEVEEEEDMEGTTLIASAGAASLRVPAGSVLGAQRSPRGGAAHQSHPADHAMDSSARRSPIGSRGNVGNSSGALADQSVRLGYEENFSGFFLPESPRLLAFDEVEGMDASMAAARINKSREEHQASIRSKLHKAVSKVKPGCCVICVCVEVNPIAEIELLALQLKQSICVVDLGVKLRLRPKPEQLAQQLVECMKSGSWFIFTHANKSISSLRTLELLVKEMREHNMQGVHSDARVIICTEPHPHFPVLLTVGAVITRIHTSFANSSLMSVTLASSTSAAACTRLVIASGSLSHSSSASPKSTTTNTSTTSEGGTAVQVPSSAPSSLTTLNAKKKRVRLSAAVDIVDIEPRELLAGNAGGAGGKSQSTKPIDVSGSVALRNTFSGILNDKFLCIKPAGDAGRFAIGSSLGNVYFLDGHGNSMLQVHAHDACIWDLAFHSKYHFATASEDGSATQWQFTTEVDETEVDGGEPGLEQTITTMLGADVYCTSFVNSSDPHTPLVAGGLSSHLLIQKRDGTTSFLQTPSNCQVIAPFPDTNSLLVGGGDGSIAIIDVSSSGGAVTAVLSDHTRKVPTLSVRDANQFFSGSFDSTIRAWDYRQGSSHATHTLKLKNYVTGLSVDDVHLAASVGENLYLWDIRKLNEVLGGYPQGWKGLSRGICVQSDSKLVVTASPDGNVRFWHFV